MHIADQHELLTRSIIDLVACSAFLIDPTDKVALKNRSADQLVATGRGLSIERGTLVADWSDETERLARALRKLRDGHEEIMVAIGRQACPSPLSVRLAKLGTDSQWCVVLVADPTAGHGVDPDALRAWYGLTRRESQIAASVAEGRSVEESSHVLGISRGTAATHLKHIYCKLGVNSQAQLVSLLSRLPHAIEAPPSTRASADR